MLGKGELRRDAFLHGIDRERGGEGDEDEAAWYKEVKRPWAVESMSTRLRRVLVMLGARCWLGAARLKPLREAMVV